MKIGNIAGLIDGSMSVVYDSGELTSAQTSITITGLDGDVDEQYQLIVFADSDSVAGNDYNVRPNNDTSTSNYGLQGMRAQSTSATAYRSTSSAGLMLNWASHDTGTKLFGVMTINATSGKERTALAKTMYDVTGTTVGELSPMASVWNNTTDNITSLTVLSLQSNGLGIGSRIILLKKAQGGMQTGNLEVVGDLEYQW